MPRPFDPTRGYWKYQQFKFSLTLNRWWFRCKSGRSVKTSVVVAGSKQTKIHWNPASWWPPRGDRLYARVTSALFSVRSGRTSVSFPHLKTLLTLLPRVIIFKFPLQPRQKYNITHSMENLTFHSLPRKRWLYYQFSLPYLYSLSLQRLGESYFLSLGVRGFIQRDLYVSMAAVVTGLHCITWAWS